MKIATGQSPFLMKQNKKKNSHHINGKKSRRIMFKSERKLEEKNVPDSGKEQPETGIVI